MALVPVTNLSRINPSWTPAVGDLGLLGEFLNRRRRGGPIGTAAAPKPGKPLSPAAVQALDDLEHQCDLISTRPTAAERAWVLSRVCEVA